jgi:hypothetical protein
MEDAYISKVISCARMACARMLHSSLVPLALGGARRWRLVQCYKIDLVTERISHYRVCRFMKCPRFLINCRHAFKTSRAR